MLTREAIRLRQSADWNIALHKMAQETDPLAEQAISLANVLAKQAKARLEAEILARKPPPSQPFGV